MRHGKYPFIISFLAVPVALYAVFVIGACFQTFQLSFSSFTGFGDVNFIGLANYKYMWADPAIWQALQHHAILLVFLPLITIVLALIFAFFLNVGGGSKRGVMRGVWGSKFYRVVYFFPQLLALAVVAVIFGRVYSPDQSGLINGLLPKGVGPI